MRVIAMLLMSSASLCFAQDKAASTPIPMRDVIKSVKPDYPQEARHRHITGSGIVVLNVDRASGRVTSVTMAQSTGHKILDDAAIHTFSQWRFKPGVVSEGKVKIPINFRMGGVRSRMAGAALDRAY
jgi:protein TonB